MNTVKIIILSILVSLVLSGCSPFGGAVPYYYNNGYYMVGDSKCPKFETRSSDSINCFNSKGKHTERRYAMGPNELQAYDTVMVQYRQQQAATSASLDELLTPTPTNTLGFPNSTLQPNQTTSSYGSDYGHNSGTPIYTAGECKGSVVNNRCVGVIIPKPGYTKKCYGPIVLGECRGAYY